MSATGSVRIVLGTMAMGGTADLEHSRLMLDAFGAKQRTELDTAIMYQGGKTEAILGELGMQSAIVATKVNPWWRDGANATIDPRGGLSRENVREQITKSLAALKRESVDILYLHAPDHETPILETLAEIDALKREGKFVEFGLSNYAAWQVADIWQLCMRNSYVLPTVYQGMYNCITRAVEDELLPCLRAHSIRFYAYNPLGGGILTGRYAASDDPQDGRYAGTTFWGKAYRQRYWNESVFAALELLKAECAAAGISLTAAALRWMVHHSALQADDAVIVGASSVAHLEENLDAVAGGPLPQSIVDAAANAAAVARPAWPKYFR